MMKGLTIQQLAAKIAANQEDKKDFITPVKTLEMVLVPEQVGDRVIQQPNLVIEGQGTFGIRQTAHDQVGGHLVIPSKYYDRMLRDQPQLLVDNVNTWLRTADNNRMVRTLGGSARAFLSDRYNRIENEEIANVALPILADIPGVQIVSSEVTERRMYIQAVTPRLEAEVKKGDVVQAGVVISNSEIGYGSVSISELDWRLWCLNGAISEKLLRAYHVGRQIDDNAALWADDTRKADDTAVLKKVRDMVRAAVDETRFNIRIEKMRNLVGIEMKATTDPARAVEVLAQKVKATDGERGGILSALIKGGDLTAWGFFNAVTAQAHTASSYDRAVQFEQAGGQLLELNKKEWAEVLEAA